MVKVKVKVVLKVKVEVAVERASSPPPPPRRSRPRSVVVSRESCERAPRARCCRWRGVAVRGAQPVLRNLGRPRRTRARSRTSPGRAAERLGRGRGEAGAARRQRRPLAGLLRRRLRTSGDRERHPRDPEAAQVVRDAAGEQGRGGADDQGVAYRGARPRPHLLLLLHRHHRRVALYHFPARRRRAGKWCTGTASRDLDIVDDLALTVTFTRRRGAGKWCAGTMTRDLDLDDDSATDL